ncbi:MAG: TRAP transporter small permease subunit [Rhodobacter sp.]|nr:TRAP transporter small permease subunit [Rhodobacter sp.]
MRALLATLDEQLGRLAGLFALAGAAGILVLLGVTVVAVFWRYVLNAPIFGIEDVSIVTLTVVAAGSVAYGGSKGAHVSINLLTYFWGRRVTRLTDAVMRFAVAAIALLAAYALVTKACGLEKACITSNLAIEHRVFFYVLAAAMGLYGVNVAVHLAIGLAHWNEARDPNEVED